MDTPLVRTHISFAMSPDVYRIAEATVMAVPAGPVRDSMFDGDPHGIFPAKVGKLGYILMMWVFMPAPESTTEAPAWLPVQEMPPMELNPTQNKVTIIAPLHARVRIAVTGRNQEGRLSPPLGFEFIVRGGAPELAGPGIWITGVETPESEEAPQPKLVSLSIGGKPVVEEQVVDDVVTAISNKLDLPLPGECDPPNACATTGMCWTHSEWADGTETAGRKTKAGALHPVNPEPIVEG